MTPNDDRHRENSGPFQPAIRVVMMPRDTNALGTIFGGIILSYIDQAGAIEGSRHVSGRLVTVAMNEVEFHAPVFVGDLVSFYTETVRRGRTSVTVRVTVEAQRRHRGKVRELERVKVTEAQLTFVHVGEDGTPIPLEDPGVEGKETFLHSE
jgi:acyl-CoA thioesterase YciA